MNKETQKQTEIIPLPEEAIDVINEANRKMGKSTHT